MRFSFHSPHRSTAPGGTGVIALVPDHWGEVATARHHVLSRLAQRFPVVWIEPAMHWRTAVQTREPGAAVRATPPGLTVMAPRWHHAEVYRAPWLSRLSLRRRLRAARRALQEQGVARIVLYLWRDEFAPALDLVQHDASVYHVDDEYTFSPTERPTPPREATLLSRVDRVIVHSPALMAKKARHNLNTVRVPNGVDYAAFVAPTDEPADLARVPRPRLGYTGVIKRQLDFELLLSVANQRRDCSLVLIGPVLPLSSDGAAFAALVRQPNVYLLGEKPLSALPAYMQHVDVNLMCYRVNDYTRYIHPLKLNEYLAAGPPVISTPIAAVASMTSLVGVAGDTAQWLAAIDAALLPAAQSGTATQARRAEAQRHDWSTLVERIGDLIELTVEHKRATASAAETEHTVPPPARAWGL